MRNGYVFIIFLFMFLNFFVIGMANHERHNKIMNEIQKLEYKIDSIQVKCDSLQNILKYNYESNKY